MIKSLQGLRLLGIITIVAGHAGLSLWGGGDWCSFFFILSGFLFKTEVKSWCDYTNYVWRKAKAVYPVYWVCLISYLVLAFIRGCEEQYSINWDFIPHLALMQSWIPGIDAMAYLGPAWFLSSLMFCYCISPIARRVLNLTPFSIIGVVAIYVFFAYSIGGNAYISPSCRLMEYSFGIWLRLYVARKESRQEMFPGCNILLVFSLLCLIRVGMNPYVEILSFGIVISVLASFSSRITDWVLGNRFIIGLAKSDIFIYLIHPGIAFHVVMFLGYRNVWALIVGSIVIGYAMYWVYNKCQLCCMLQDHAS